MALAQETTFTAAEAEAYRKAEDEIEQARELAEEALARGLRERKADMLREGEARGKADGLREGKEAGLREAIADLCEVLGVELTEGRRTHLASLDVAALEALRLRIKQGRSWPDRSGE